MTPQEELEQAAKALLKSQPNDHLRAALAMLPTSTLGLIYLVAESRNRHGTNGREIEFPVGSDGDCSWGTDAAARVGACTISDGSFGWMVRANWQPLGNPGDFDEAYLIALNHNGGPR